MVNYESWCICSGSLLDEYKKSNGEYPKQVNDCNQVAEVKIDCHPSRWPEWELLLIGLLTPLLHVHDYLPKFPNTNYHCNSNCLYFALYKDMMKLGRLIPKANNFMTKLFVFYRFRLFCTATAWETARSKRSPSTRSSRSRLVKFLLLLKLSF